MVLSFTILDEKLKKNYVTEYSQTKSIPRLQYFFKYRTLKALSHKPLCYDTQRL